MKKFLVAILALVYFGSATGATLHLHYCMGKLASWGFFDHKSNACSFCGMPKKQAGENCLLAQKGCCKDEHRQIRLHQDQKEGPTTIQLTRYSAGAMAVIPVMPGVAPVSFGMADHPTANAPPAAAIARALFLLNCSFRI